MSGRLVGQCLRGSRASSPGELLVLVVIAEHAKDNGFGATLKLATIAREARMSTRQTKRYIARLWRAGDLAVVAHKGRANVYVVTPGLGTPTSQPTRDADGPTQGTQPGTSRVLTGDVEGQSLGTSRDGTGDIPEHAYRTVEPYEPYQPSPPRSGNGAAPGGAFAIPKGQRIGEVDGQYVYLLQGEENP